MFISTILIDCVDDEARAPIVVRVIRVESVSAITLRTPFNRFHYYYNIIIMYRSEHGRAGVGI